MSSPALVRMVQKQCDWREVVRASEQHGGGAKAQNAGPGFDLTMGSATPYQFLKLLNEVKDV